MKESREEAVRKMRELREANRLKMEAEAQRNRRIALAWDAWIASETGEKCLADGAYGEYLRNRLWWAFTAGAAAGME